VKVSTFMDDSLFPDRRERWQFRRHGSKAQGISVIGYSIFGDGNAQEGFRLSIDQPNLIP
jgi:hypothetical protein